MCLGRCLLTTMPSSVRIFGTHYIYQFRQVPVTALLERTFIRVGLILVEPSSQEPGASSEESICHHNIKSAYVLFECRSGLLASLRDRNHTEAAEVGPRIDACRGFHRAQAVRRRDLPLK